MAGGQWTLLALITSVSLGFCCFCLCLTEPRDLTACDLMKWIGKQDLNPCLFEGLGCLCSYKGLFGLMFLSVPAKEVN